MKNLLVIAGLLVIGIAHADGLPPMAPTITITIPPPMQPYPLSFCGQYPNADACKQKPAEEVHHKCIDGQLYHKVYGADGRSEWRLVYVDNQPETCSGNYQE